MIAKIKRDDAIRADECGDDVPPDDLSRPTAIDEEERLPLPSLAHGESHGAVGDRVVLCL